MRSYLIESRSLSRQSLSRQYKSPPTQTTRHSKWSACHSNNIGDLLDIVTLQPDVVDLADEKNTRPFYAACHYGSTDCAAYLASTPGLVDLNRWWNT